MTNFEYITLFPLINEKTLSGKLKWYAPHYDFSEEDYLFLIADENKELNFYESYACRLKNGVLMLLKIEDKNDSNEYDIVVLYQYYQYRNGERKLIKQLINTGDLKPEFSSHILYHSILKIFNKDNLISNITNYLENL